MKISREVTVTSSVRGMDNNEPNVINDELIRMYLVQYNKEHDIYDKDDLPYEYFIHLALSYKNIVEISHLEGLDRLQKLQLDNNQIKKIENLGHLTNLEWLDLSFNRITKIEGLDELIQLTDLSLYCNKITTLEGMDNLHNLNFLSIGKNDIVQADSVTGYLPKFKNLQVLIVKDNPFLKDLNEKFFKELKNLKYLDYSIVDDPSGKIEKDIDMGGVGGEKKNKAEAQNVKDQRAKARKDAKIEVAYNLLNKLKHEDENMIRLQLIPGQSDHWTKFEEELKEKYLEFEEAAIKCNTKKTGEMQTCKSIIKNEEDTAEKESIKLMDEFNHKLKNATNKSKSRELSEEEYDDLLTEVMELEDKLMEIEMDNVVRLDQLITQKMREELTRTTGEFEQKLMEFQDSCNAFQLTYTNALRLDCEKEQTNFQNDMEGMTARYEEKGNAGMEVIDLLNEPEGLTDANEKSKDYQEGAIKDMESRINRETKADRDNFLNGLTERVTERNRDIVKQIVMLIPTLRNKIEMLRANARSEDYTD